MNDPLKLSVITLLVLSCHSLLSANQTLDGLTKVEGPIYIDDTITDSAADDPITGQWNVTLENGLFIWGDNTVSSPQTWGTGAPVLFWYPEKSAFRAGIDNYGMWSQANLGDRSVAFGTNTKANGSSTAAFGDTTTASGYASTAFGTGTMATGGESVAFGSQSSAIGSTSSAFGFATTAPNSYQTTIGLLNLGVSGAVLEVGNGDDSYYLVSNALTVLKNGQTTLSNRYWSDLNDDDDNGFVESTESTESNRLSIISDPNSSSGTALKVDGHAEFGGRVTLESAQGDILMGAYGISN